MAILVNNRRITIKPSMSIGKGGEADVYMLDSQTALKLFKQPDHPDFAGNLQAQQASRERLKEHQRKLPAFPAGLPVAVVKPIDLARDDRGIILGYTMQLVKKAEPILRYSERSYHNAGLSMNKVIQVFHELHVAVTGIHAKSVVIGDFNDLNILISQAVSTVSLIDADSYQYGGFYCHLFTMQFIDPLLCDATQKIPMPIKTYNTDSDWYAYNVMLVRSLLCVDPYGGIYRPKNKANRIPQTMRPLRRISVFHKEVTYPKPAFPLDTLPDELLQHFCLCFGKDQRGVFPEKLIRSLRWARCRVCGAEYARPVCPVCHKGRQAARLVTVRGNVTCRNVYRTMGRIVFAVYQDGMRWLEVRGDKLFRENGYELRHYYSSAPNIKYEISGHITICADREWVVADTGDGKIWSRLAETVGASSAIAANSNHIYWCSLGRIMRNGDMADFYIGDTLENQTQIWVGERFGFGFYRAGKIEQAFVFDAERAGINDNVALPRMTGQLLDAACAFSRELYWFFATLQDGQRRVNRCTIITRKGEVITSIEEPTGSDKWLGTISGKIATGNSLLCPTDNGVVRVVVDDAGITEVKTFPDTEPFVDSSVSLLAGKEGLYIVKQQEINLLTIR